MDSSNAEKAWEAYLAHGWVGTQSQFIIAKDGFMAGRASRDAEVAELREQIAAAEAALATGLEWLNGDVLKSHDQWEALFSLRSGTEGSDQPSG